MTERFLTEQDASMDEPIAVVYSIRRGDIPLYDRGMAEDPVLQAQEDRLSHVCFEDDDGYTVIDVWRSQAAFERFEAHFDEVAPGRKDPEHRLYSARFSVRRVHNLVL